MRDSKIPIEYRCQCGKLLCKGSLFLSSVEIKCKRCGKLTCFEESLPTHVSHIFLVRDGEEPPVDIGQAKAYNGNKIAGYRIYTIDRTNKNLLQ